MTDGTGDALEAPGLEAEILDPQAIQGPQAVTWSFEPGGCLLGHQR